MAILLPMTTEYEDAVTPLCNNMRGYCGINPFFKWPRLLEISADFCWSHNFAPPALKAVPGPQNLNEFARFTLYIAH